MSQNSKEIIEELIESYSCCRSYFDSGYSWITNQRSICVFTSLFERPKKFALRWYDFDPSSSNFQGEKRSSIFARDTSVSVNYWWDCSEVRYRTDLFQEFKDAAGTSSGISLIVPPILFDGMHSLIEDLRNTAIVKSDSRGFIWITGDLENRGDTELIISSNPSILRGVRRRFTVSKEDRDRRHVYEKEVGPRLPLLDTLIQSFMRIPERYKNDDFEVNVHYSEVALDYPIEDYLFDPSGMPRIG